MVGAEVNVPRVYQVVRQLAHEQADYYGAVPPGLQNKCRDIVLGVLKLDDAEVQEAILVGTAVQHAEGQHKDTPGERYNEWLRKPIGGGEHTEDVRAEEAIWHMRTDLAETAIKLDVPLCMPEYGALSEYGEIMPENEEILRRAEHFAVAAVRRYLVPVVEQRGAA